MLAEKCNEFNVPMWVATLDFKKAFDSVDHTCIWASLSAHGVPAIYINLLSKLYQGQRATVKCDVDSREFLIRKGTKQGDPISPLIFNAVLECVMRNVKAKWTRKQYGLQLGHIPETLLSNLRFADDILLIGRSLPQLKKMIADVVLEARRVGLELHPQKTKIQHNNIGYGSRVRSATINGMVIEMMDPSDSNMYLGRALCLTNVHDVELRHRLQKAWGKFAIFKNELTNKDVPFPLRLRLFHAVVTPTVLYGSSSWVMTHARTEELNSVQMRMLRSMLGRKRQIEISGELETWVSWLRRTTHDVRQAMSTCGMPSWDDARKARLQSWKQRLSHMMPQRWAKRALAWCPNGFRQRGHPCARWADQ
jgi:hypothetical protein